MSRFTVTADYQVIDRAPLNLEVDDMVRLGPADADWPGWIWVTAVNGRGSYVPEDHLDTLPDGTARVRTAFQAHDLSVRRGDGVESLREVRGWHWCRDHAGVEGWLPAYLLRAAAI